MDGFGFGTQPPLLPVKNLGSRIFAYVVDIYVRIEANIIRNFRSKNSASVARLCSACCDGWIGCTDKNSWILRSTQDDKQKTEADSSPSEEQAEGPGLKPLDSIGLIQGAEAPCSLR
jgi:hypothetical protein